MARKISPTTVLKRVPITSTPRIQLSRATNTNAPTQAPSSRKSPPMTAIMSTSIVRASEIEPGEMRVFHQTERIPARAATKAPRPKATVRRSSTL